jgi:hypothetical protein
MTQLPLIPDRCPKFDGKPFDVEIDAERLGHQLETIRIYMLGRSDWRSLLEIERDTGVLTASAGARLRDLRKQKFGGYEVARRRRDGGTFEYRVENL